jgi:hypothetical protein
MFADVRARARMPGTEREFVNKEPKAREQIGFARYSLPQDVVHALSVRRHAGVLEAHRTVIRSPPERMMLG